ncbi:MAG: hypothetical protein II458_02030, partial [Oscillospiraceae bacterium]|nr:hypothetical protein [Oscillospiraceae bacterium]
YSSADMALKKRSLGAAGRVPVSSGGRPMAAPTACLLSKTDNQNPDLPKQPSCANGEHEGFVHTIFTEISCEVCYNISATVAAYPAIKTKR